MASITKLTFKSQTTQPISLPEGSIQAISPETLESIRFLPNQSESTPLVNRVSDDLSLPAVKKSKNHELKQTIRLITKKLNPDKHASCITDLAELQNAHQSLSSTVTTSSEVHLLFLINKGLVIGILRTLPEEERDQLEIAIGEELPDSMKDLFEISKLNLGTIENLDLLTFFTLLQSYEPLSIKDRKQAVWRAAKIDNLEFVKLLLAPISEDPLANAPIYDRCLEGAVWEATFNDNLEIVELILPHVSITEKYRGNAVLEATINKNSKLVKLLLADGPISQEHREGAIVEANNNPAIVKLLNRSHTFESPISLPEGPISTIPSEILISIIMLINEIERTQLVNRNWNKFTLIAVKTSINYELNQSIQLVTKTLNPDIYAKCITDLTELQNTHQSLSNHVASLAQVRRLFLNNKGLAIGILRKLPEDERDQLQIAIGEEFPDSMKDLFMITKINLENIENLHLDTFITLLQSYEPLSLKDRNRAVACSAKIMNLEFVKLLLTPISQDHLAEHRILSMKQFSATLKHDTEEPYRNPPLYNLLEH